jgi:hypothetical protein
MSSEALELALALYRAPSQRFVLRDRALPADIGQAIRLASGNSELLRHAAAVLREPESVVLEAVRFYLQQVLFDPDADAYRTLGLERGAPHERIRDHYHWLQRWLHPDRRGEDWVALYATRVNGAWSHLRNKASRESYDLAQGPTQPGTNVVHHPVGGVWMPIPTALPQRNWLRLAVLGALLTSCAVLLIAVLLREDPAPADWAITGRSGVAEGGSSTPSASAGRRQRRAPNGMLVTSATAARTPPTASLTKPTPGAAAIVTRPALASVPRPTSVQTRKPGAVTSSQPVPPSMVKLSMPDSVPTPTDIGSAAQPPTRAVNRTGRTRPLARGRRAEPQAPAGIETDQRSDGLSSVVVAEAVSPAADAGLRSNADTTAAQMTARPLARQAAVGRYSPTSRSARHMARPTLPDIPTIVAVEPPATIEPTAEPAAEPSPPISATTTPAEMVARMNLARKRVRELTAYFDGSKTSLPPSWLDVEGQLSTERLRSSLYARNQLQDFAAFALEAPRWYLSQDRAGVSATYHVRRESSLSESGRFFVDMTWRGSTWHVTRVALEPAP